MKQIDRKKIALIHIVKKELGLSEKKYRDILNRAAGVTSAKELDYQRFRQLMRFFVRSKHYRVNRLGLTLKQKLFIDYLAKQLGWDKKHLDNFINKYYHKETVYKLSKKEGIKAIESLKAVIGHRGLQMGESQ